MSSYRCEREPRRRSRVGGVALAAVVLSATMSLSASPAPAADLPAGTIITVAGGYGTGGAFELDIEPKFAPLAVGEDILFADDVDQVLRRFHGLTGRITVEREIPSDPFSEAIGDRRTATGGDGAVYVAAPRSIDVMTPTGLVNVVTSDNDDCDPTLDHPATDACLAALEAPTMAFDAAGRLFFIDQRLVRRLDADGVVRRVAGGGTPETGNGDGGPATSADLYPRGLAFSITGDLLIADYSSIRRVDGNGIISTFAGGGVLAGSSGDGGPATQAGLGSVKGLAVIGTNTYISSDDINTSSGRRIRRVDAGGVITTLASGTSPLIAPRGGNLIATTDESLVEISTTSGASTLLAAADDCFRCVQEGIRADEQQLTFVRPHGVTADGSIHFSTGFTQIHKIDAAGVVRHVMGNGSPSISGDGGPAKDAGMWVHRSIVLPDGTAYLGSPGRIRHVGPDGVISTIAGNGVVGRSGDGGPAKDATLGGVGGLAVMPDGSVVFIDNLSSHSVIRKISPDGIIQTIAGRLSPRFYTGTPNGDGGDAREAYLDGISAIGADGVGNVLLGGDGGGLRRIDPAGRIETLHDDPSLAWVAPNGDAYVILSPPVLDWALDASRSRIVRVKPTGAVEAVAGNGSVERTPVGDGGPATSAYLWPGSSVGTPAGDLVVSDGGFLGITPRLRLVYGGAPTAATPLFGGRAYAARTGAANPLVDSARQVGGEYLSGEDVASVADGEVALSGVSSLASASPANGASSKVSIASATVTLASGPPILLRGIATRATAECGGEEPWAQSRIAQISVGDVVYGPFNNSETVFLPNGVRIIVNGLSEEATSASAFAARVVLPRGAGEVTLGAVDAQASC